MKVVGRNETETMKNSPVSDRISRRHINMTADRERSRESAMDVSLPIINFYIEIYRTVQSSEPKAFLAVE